MTSESESKKRAIVRDYIGLTKKYLHVRDMSDKLLEFATGSYGWRNCTTREDNGDVLKPFSPTVFRKKMSDMDPMLFDYSWNHYDMTQYLHWSIYHLFAEWLIPADENGYGGLNLGVQEVPSTGGGPMHKGLLDVVFASWDNPSAYCAFPITGESALLIRFWNYDREKHAFTLRSDGPLAALLMQWNVLPDNGLEMWTMPLTRDPALQLENVEYIDEDIGVKMPHEDEESRSFGMAIREMGRRHRFDPTGYDPVWSLKPDRAKPTDRVFDRFAVDLATEAELHEMSYEEVAEAYDSLWQRYLSNKMMMDFALRHKVNDPKELPAPLAEMYGKFPLVDSE